MLKILLSNDRGFSQRDWLQSKHSFSFADYYNPNYVHFNALRVLNEDFINSDGGFPMHEHDNMEMITYIIKGEITHQDSLNNSAVLRTGDVQLMRAGSGISHSEFIHSSQLTHLLQIWILPSEKNLVPGYQQKNFTNKIHDNTFTKIVSSVPTNETLHIKQNVEIYIAKFKQDTTTIFNTDTKHNIYIHIINGQVNINNCDLFGGDGASIDNESTLNFSFSSNTEFLLIEFK
jgi:redox-sensitive bicupin YhaK (pirin superfamily)